jgi:hydroxyacylglutathione hydrolase
MMKIRSVQIFKDNYSYIIQCTTTGLTAIVDPAEPEKVIKALESDIPSQLLTTHHHADHSMGNKRIKKVYSDIRVFGGDDRIPGLNIKLKHNDVFNLGELEIKALITAGHTTGHVCYYAKSKAGHGAVFTGDTLFIGG